MQIKIKVEKESNESGSELDNRIWIGAIPKLLIKIVPYFYLKFSFKN